MENLMKIIFYCHAKKPLWKKILPFFLLDFCLEPTYSSFHPQHMHYNCFCQGYRLLLSCKIQSLEVILLDYQHEKLSTSSSWQCPFTGFPGYQGLLVFFALLGAHDSIYLHGGEHTAGFSSWTSPLLFYHFTWAISPTVMVLNITLCCQLPNSYLLLSFLLWNFNLPQHFTGTLRVQSVQSSTPTSDPLPLNLFLHVSKRQIHSCRFSSPNHWSHF